MNNANLANIFIIEDDRAVRNLITTTLDTGNYHYQTAENGNSGIMGILSSKPDVIILDLGLPDMDGVEIIKKVRSWSLTPIIVVSARSDDKDKIQALDAGADDYLTKPFSTDELLARLRVALRRVQNMNRASGTTEEKVFKNGDLTIDYPAGCVLIKNEEIHLTPNEYKLICLLSKNVGKVLTHNFILKEIWGTALASDNQSLRVFMATLRKKIKDGTGSSKYIQTHVGIGYRMIKIEDEN